MKADRLSADCSVPGVSVDVRYKNADTSRMVLNVVVNLLYFLLFFRNLYIRIVDRFLFPLHLMTVLLSHHYVSPTSILFCCFELDLPYFGAYSQSQICLEASLS